MVILNEEKYYLPLESILNDVNARCIKMEEDHTKKCVEIARKVVDVIIKMQRENDVFNQFYSRIDYVGSYFDGLRVKSATEFDLNIIMKLPLNYTKIKVENINVPSGYVKVNIEDAKKYLHYTGEAKKIIDKWCDTKGFLQQNKFRAWMEGLCAKTIGTGELTIEVSGRKVKLCKVTKSGPAFTLRILNDCEKIDVDLVFTLEFENKPPSPIRWDPKIASAWVLVPKECGYHQEKNIFWRISFPASEKLLMQNRYKLKYTNRFLKALRDAQNLNLPSYFIKTVFLWEAHDCLFNSKPHFWEKNLGYLFIYALSKLHDYLNEKKLPFYWHKNMNLFTSLDDSNMKNMKGHLNAIVRKINYLLSENNINKLEENIFSLFKVSVLDNTTNKQIFGNIITDYVSGYTNEDQVLDNTTNSNAQRCTIL